MTVCNSCGKQNATIYFKGVVNNHTVKMHLCESCAKKKGLSIPFDKSIFSLGDMIANLMATPRPQDSLMGTFCKGCGLTYAELKSSGQLGCSTCYSTFAQVIGPLVKNIHGSSQHLGKTYRKTVRAVPPLQELSRLKLELQQSLQQEAYERAADLRDQIQSLERQMTTPQKPQTHS